ncbi:nuclear transport factor 2 family protein [Amycolatopsis taiwanensis]|uniref:nuclear transport factor 2 family protein n=1 Tax=Amycolatopsis taiwanensis TaxID=342230 RepID=UPI000487099F|nr:nuclear transport factor 2 family protein [Amycolatopsis taiwanensis]
MTEPGELRILLDKQAIREVVMRYCRGIDRLDFDLVRSVYHADGVDHHTGFDGPVDDYLAWVAPLLRLFGGTTHIVGNHLSEIRGDVAVAETYGTAVHWGDPPSDPRRNFTTGFRYVDHMARRDGRWAIVERFAVREWTHSDVDTRIEPEAKGPRGRRDGLDPVFELRRRVLPEEPTG